MHTSKPLICTNERLRSSVKKRKRSVPAVSQGEMERRRSFSNLLISSESNKSHFKNKLTKGGNEVAALTGRRIRFFFVSNLPNASFSGWKWSCEDERQVLEIVFRQRGWKKVSPCLKNDSFGIPFDCN